MIFSFRFFDKKKKTIIFFKKKIIIYKIGTLPVPIYKAGT